jgi:hypothetical protein
MTTGTQIRVWVFEVVWALVWLRAVYILEYDNTCSESRTRMTRNRTSAAEVAITKLILQRRNVKVNKNKDSFRSDVTQRFREMPELQAPCRPFLRCAVVTATVQISVQPAVRFIDQQVEMFQSLSIYIL